MSDMVRDFYKMRNQTRPPLMSHRKDPRDNGIKLDINQSLIVNGIEYQQTDL